MTAEGEMRSQASLEKSKLVFFGEFDIYREYAYAYRGRRKLWGK